MDRLPATQQEWRDLYEIVLTYALRLTSSREVAEDLTQEAFARLKKTRPWEPAREPSLAKHLMKIVKSVRSQEIESEAARQEREMSASIEQKTLGGAATPSAEELSLDAGDGGRRRRAAARRLTLLREMLTGLDLELQLIDLEAEGVDDRGKQAERAGATREEVYEAWRRIRRYYARIPAHALRDDDEEVA